MPALAQLSAEDNSADYTDPGWIAWVAPPFQPYPPALQQWGVNLSHMLIVRPKDDSEMLWSAEQALSSGTCAAVLLWPDVLDDQAFRPPAARSEPSAAALRIELLSSGEGTRLSILKNRGGRPAVLHDLL